MAIKTSGVIVFETHIVGEFLGARPHSLSEYYRGGVNVPNSPINSNVPTQGEIKFSDFYGASRFYAASYTISGRNTNQFAQTAINQEAGLQPGVGRSYRKYFWRTFQGVYIPSGGIGTSLTTPNMNINIRGDEDEDKFDSDENTGIRNPGVEIVYRSARNSAASTVASYRGSGASTSDDGGILTVGVTGGTYTANAAGYYTYRWVADVFSESIGQAPVNIFQSNNFTLSTFGVTTFATNTGTGWG